MKKILLILLFPVLLGFSKPFGFGIVKSKNHERPNVGKYSKILDNHNSFYIGKDSKEIYLTFDMGYENGNTEIILNTLKEKDVKATFFVTGYYLEKNNELIKRMNDDGHIVANHTWNHIDITKSNKELIEKETESVREEYKNITGCEMEKYIRPPKGTFNDESLSILDDLGYKTVFWSLAYKDWETKNQKGEDYAFNSVTEQLHNGAIILLHAVSNDNTHALGKIIDEARNMGYNFINIDNI